MEKNRLSLVAFDLDGTLLDDNKQISQTDLQTLELLGKAGIIRVVATGRNLHSIHKVLSPSFPADFVVFSSGTGIFDWKSKQLLAEWHLESDQINQIIQIVLHHKLNFSIHLPSPQNHQMFLYLDEEHPEDLANYSLFYQDFINPLNLKAIPNQASQMIILLNNHRQLYQQIKEKLNLFTTVLTTSPINHKSMWMEVFHHEVSKAKGIRWICNYLNLEFSGIMAVGNDYNDIDMLEEAHYPFVTENAPADLKERFPVTLSNNKNGVSSAILGKIDLIDSNLVSNNPTLINQCKINRK